MRVLFVLTELPYPPSRNGIALINHELLSRAPADIRIDILVTGIKESDEDLAGLRVDAPAVDQIDFTGESLSRKYRVGNLLSGALFGQNLFTQPGVQRHFRQRRSQHDAIYVAPLMTGFDFRLAKPLFLNAVDSFARLNENAYRRTGRWRDRLKMLLYRAYERRALGTASVINFVSSADLESVRAGAPELPLISISNGVDSSRFFPDEAQRIPGRMLFTGNYDYAPNAEAARHLVTQIFPLIRAAWPAATLQIVGRNPPAAVTDCPGVIVTGFVDDIAACYRSAEVFVCPLLSGAGVKNKVLEALSSGLPVVTTPLGIEGIEQLEDGRHYLLANDPREIAKQVVAVFQDTALRRSLGQEARSIVIRHHSWAPIADRYFDALRQTATMIEQVAS